MGQVRHSALVIIVEPHDSTVYGRGFNTTRLVRGRLVNLREAPCAKVKQILGAFFTVPFAAFVDPGVT